MRVIKSTCGAILVAAIYASGPSLAHASGESNAKQLFEAMSNYITKLKTISFAYDATLDVVTSDLQKMQILSSGTLKLERPDKLRMTRASGFADVEISYNGSVLTALEKQGQVFSQLNLTGSIDELVDQLRIAHDIEAPAADLISSNPSEVMLKNVVDAKDLGSGIVGGVECDHLAFRTKEVDWEIWIARGDAPYPCRFTITSKLMAQAPSYTVVVREWKSADKTDAADDFTLNVGSAKSISISEFPAANAVPTELARELDQ